MTKRILALMAAVAVGACVTAQTLTVGAETKRLDADRLAEACLPGEYKGLQCIVMQDVDHFDNVRKHDYALILVDNNLEPLYGLELPHTDKLELLGATLEGDRAAVIFADREEKRQTVVLGAVVELDSMRLAGNRLDTLLNQTYGRKDAFHLWTDARDGKVALLQATEYGDSKEYTARATLYDINLRRLWSREHAIGTTDQLWVTADGKMVTIGTDNMKQGDVAITLNVIGREDSVTQTAHFTCDSIRDLRLLNVTGGRAVAAGRLEQGGKHTDDHITLGVVAVAFGLDGTVAGFSMRPFQNEDIDILLNEKTKKTQKHLEAEYVRVEGRAALPYGGAMALGRAFRHSKQDVNGTYSNDYNRVGLHVVAVDTDGQVRWVRNLRRCDMQKSSDSDLRVFLAAKGDSLLVVKKESPKLPSGYELAKQAKEFDIEDKGHTVVYCMAPDGTTTKHLLDLKSKHAPRAIQADGSHDITLITSRGKYSRLGVLTMD